MSRKETRLFFRNDPPPVKEKAGFLRHSRKKKMYKKFLIRYLSKKTLIIELKPLPVLFLSLML
ncbi:Uncharacterized protein dnm_043660 [Desulfonema magnum]|uniref:Uncharacterized protein n=1 Tax=Desulfonema magnum TaxID=45655 RepID=A0A975BNA3_9BACT|nr:Uncharacterized protein dnm_043660 [Desulfonema magnum]